MADLTDRLTELRRSDPEVASILDFYIEVEQAYRDSLEAMGVSTRTTAEVGNSSSVTLSFRDEAAASI